MSLRPTLIDQTDRIMVDQDIALHLVSITHRINRQKPAKLKIMLTGTGLCVYPSRATDDGTA